MRDKITWIMYSIVENWGINSAGWLTSDMPAYAGGNWREESKTAFTQGSQWLGFRVLCAGDEAQAYLLGECTPLSSSSTRHPYLYNWFTTVLILTGQNIKHVAKTQM